MPVLAADPSGVSLNEQVDQTPRHQVRHSRNSSTSHLPTPFEGETSLQVSDYHRWFGTSPFDSVPQHDLWRIITEKHNTSSHQHRTTSIKQYLDSANAFSNHTGLQIRVLGVPQTNAKSRVETQIKICIQLVTNNGDKVSAWPHLRLPPEMLAKEKLRRKGWLWR